MTDLKETARLILLQVEHNKDCGKEDVFTIEEIEGIIKRRVLGITNNCQHNKSSSWGRLATCLDCGFEWIKDEE